MDPITIAALIAAGDPNALGFWIGLAMYVAVLVGTTDDQQSATQRSAVEHPVGAALPGGIDRPPG